MQFTSQQKKVSTAAAERATKVKVVVAAAEAIGNCLKIAMKIAQRIIERIR